MTERAMTQWPKRSVLTADSVAAPLRHAVFRRIWLARSVPAWLSMVTPPILLALCFVVGSGMALFGPAWQSSVSEQVPAETLPWRAPSRRSR
jgi:hypothetical protein